MDPLDVNFCDRPEFIVERETLKNGLRVVYLPFSHATTTSMAIAFRAGVRFETLDTLGISHLAEHVLFRCSPLNSTGNSVNERLDRIGAEYNATTYKDQVMFYAHTAARFMPQALDAVADMVVKRSFCAEDLNIEKGVVMQEMEAVTPGSLSQAVNSFESLLYSSSLGWPNGGTPQTIQGLRYMDMHRHLKSFFGARNAVLVVAGCVTDQVRKTIADRFVHMHEGHRVSRLPDANLVNNRVSVFPDTESGRTSVTMGVAVSGAEGMNDFGALSLLGNYLAVGTSGQVYLKLREETGLTYGISSSMQNFVDTGYFLIRFDVDGDDLVTALNLAISQFQQLGSNGISISRLQYLQDSAIGQNELTQANRMVTAMTAARQQLFYHEIMAPDMALHAMQGLTIDYVNAVAQRYFNSNNYRFVLQGAINDPQGAAQTLGVQWGV